MRRSLFPTIPNRESFRVRDVARPRGLADDAGSITAAVCAPDVDRILRISDKAAGDPVMALDEHYEQATT